MNNENFLEKLASQFGQSASVRNVYGEPIHVGEKTIVPVAHVAYGLGGGYGHGKHKPNPFKELADVNKDSAEVTKDNVGEGAGGGGGMFAKPKGIYEITPTSTRFIPASGSKILVAGMLLGFMLRGFMRRRKKIAR